MVYDTFIWLQTFLILILGFPAATLVSAWIVAKFIWAPYVLKCEKDAKDMPPLLYSLRYPFIHDKLVTDNSGQILEHALVLENTEQGHILMKYNEKGDIFEYWADDNIQYKNLETVARKFVQRFRCEHLYINRHEELRKKWKEIQEERKNENNNKSTVEKDVDNVFATLKAAKPKAKKAFISDKANKYIKRGRMNECNFFKQKKKSIKPFSFSDWKKIKLPLGFNS